MSSNNANRDLLTIRNLTIEARRRRSTPLTLVDAIDFEVRRKEVLGVVGESGSGKSITMRALIGLLKSPPLDVVAGEAIFDGVDLLGLSPSELRRVRGSRISMVFQDPMTSLNPLMRVGRQIEEALGHDSGANLSQRVTELLELVGIPEPIQRARQYPHEFSGGMRQRVMIAIAMAANPELLIADEPTTALDVTIQAQVMQVLSAVQQERGTAMVLISHDLALVSEVADRIVVMYAGTIVETGSVDEVTQAPRHPYTVGLLNSAPQLDGARGQLISIPGRPPNPDSRPTGCSFYPRCSLAGSRPACEHEVPLLRAHDTSAHLAACHYQGELVESTLSPTRENKPHG